MKKIALNSSHLSGFLVADHLVVFNRSDSQLHALDEMGGYLLLALDDGISQEEVTATLQVQGVPGTQIAESMATILSSFFNQSEPSGKYHQEYSKILATPVDVSLLGQGVCIEVGKIHFQLIATNKSIRSDLNDMFQGALLPHQDADIRVQFVINQNNDDICVECNSTECFTVAEYSQFMPRLMDHLQIMAYQAPPICWLCIQRCWRKTVVD